MSTLDQIREGFHLVWDSLAEGWESLRQSASHALTWFRPEDRAEEKGTALANLLDNCPRWSLLAAELIENDEQVRVRLEVPGMEPGNFEIQVVNNVLVIRGNKQIEHEQTEERYFLLERAYGSFERAIQLPSEVDGERAAARYKRGVLTVTLPKRQSQKVQRISIA